MKTYRNLYPQIASFANLEEAWRKARRGKRTKEAAARFEQNAEGELFQLERAVGISAGGIDPAAARQNRLKPVRESARRRAVRFNALGVPAAGFIPRGKRNDLTTREYSD